MLKMLLDPMGGIVLTNDGHAILREIEVAHPAAKSMIELSRTQDEEVGDGTTTVIILGAYKVWGREKRHGLTINSGRNPRTSSAPA
jgi:T-complex protein 1 subunit gamma